MMSERCEICELYLDQCEHGLAARKREAKTQVLVRISPNNVAHLDGCLHKDDDPDYAGWGEIHEEGAWIHLCESMPLDARKTGFVSDLTSTSGNVIGLPIMHICLDCRAKWS